MRLSLELWGHELALSLARIESGDDDHTGTPSAALDVSDFEDAGKVDCYGFSPTATPYRFTPGRPNTRTAIAHNGGAW